MKEAFAYSRVSGRGQLGGLPRQRAAIQSYAKEHGLNIVRWFEERGVPGKADADERPAFQDMLLEILSNGCRTVLVESLEHLSRECPVQEQLLICMAAREIALIDVNAGENVTDALMGDPMRRALVQIQSIFAELDKNLLLAKLRKARERTRQSEGRCEGRKRFGTRPGEQEIIQKIETLAKEGNNYSQIADQLNRDSVPTRAGKQWYPSTVANILTRK